MNMFFKSSANRKSIRLFHIWTHYNLFLVQVRVCLVVIGGEFSSKMEMVFLFRSREWTFCKTMGTVIAKQHNCRFMIIKRNIQNVAAGFALFAAVETSRFIG